MKKIGYFKIAKRNEIKSKFISYDTDSICI